MARHAPTDIAFGHRSGAKIPRLVWNAEARRHWIKHFFLVPPLQGSWLQVQGVGLWEPMSSSMIHRPYGTGDYMIMFFHDAVRAGLSPDAPILPKDSLFIWATGDGQFFGPTSPRALHSWIHCQGTLIDRLFHENASLLRTSIQTASADSFLRFISDVYQELTGPHSPDETIVSHYFENWVRQLRRSFDGAAPLIPPRLRRVQEYIDQHYARPVTLADLAALAHWSPSHFSAAFRQHFKSSPLDYVIRKRMDRAVYLLRDIHLSVAEIAQAIGYEDIYHFSKLFKKHQGLSPLAFRRSHLRPSS